MTTNPRRAVLMAVACATALSAPAFAQPTPVKSGFNVFSEQQDIEIGRQSAAQAERQLPMLNDRRVDAYASEIIRRLAAAAPGPKFPYQIRTVNASDINAFSLPGGFMYVNRGLIEAARSEPELAGVLGHEMAHVALRHGTHQASKAYLTQAGIGILGGLISKGRDPSQIMQVVGGLGLNALFLKFSRDDEYQADLVGAQIMARAGYDPRSMADFFQVLRSQQKSDPGRLQQFFSDHPAPADREARIRQEAQRIGAVTNSREVGGFTQVQAQLRGMGAAPTAQQIARGQAPRGRTPSDGGVYPASNTRVDYRIDPPSSRLATYRQREGFFSIQYPDNWRPYDPDNGFGVTIVPEGGVVNTSDGQQSIIYGVIVNHYDPFQARSAQRGSTLQDATRDLVTQVTSTNTHLRATGSQRRETIDGQPALSQVLSGRSPVTGEEERVTVFTRQLPDGHVIYSLFIAPGQDYAAMAPVFSRMVRTLQVNDEAAHR